MAVRCLILAVAFLALSFDVSVCFPKCYPLAIELCRTRNVNENGCLLFDNVTACLNDMMDDCNDQDREYAEKNLKITEDEKSRCPGLGVGDCFEHQNSMCLSNLAYPLYGEFTDAHCWEVKKRKTFALGCMEKLKKSCTSKYAMERMKMFKYSILQRDADCWFHFKYENYMGHNHTGFLDKKDLQRTPSPHQL